MPKRDDEQVKERHVMPLQGLRYTLRPFRKAPAQAVMIVVMLSFGIGATTAIFSLVEGVLVRPLPFAQPDRLVKIGDMLEGAGIGMASPGVPAPEIARYTREMHTLDGTGGYQWQSLELSGGGEPARITAYRMSASMFPLLGVAPLVGRTFTQREDDAREQVAVLSYETWQTRFHGEPHILGTKILLDRSPYLIVGVMPRAFEFPVNAGEANRSELWVPISFTEDDLTHGAWRWNFQMLGKLKAGVKPIQAQQDALRVAFEIMRDFPAGMGHPQIRSVVEPLDHAIVARVKPGLRALFFAVLVVLLIACSNLAGLLLVRSIRGQRETAVRLALGATRRTVVAQSLMETMTLSAAGGVFGLEIAWMAMRFGKSILPDSLPRVDEIGLDWRVAGFALLLAVVTGALCGWAPAFAASRVKMSEGLREGGRTGTSGTGHARLRSALVVIELAVALVLLTSAGLLLKSFVNLRMVDLGVRTDHVLTAAYDLPAQQYSKQAAVDAFNTELLSRLQQLPGVEAVGTTTELPAVGRRNFQMYVPEGVNQGKMAWPSLVRGEYFQAVGIHLLRGRFFTDADRANSPLVVIVNRKLAEQVWHGQDPIGKRIHLGAPESPLPWMRVVGEIADVKQGSADEETLPQLYQPVSQVKASASSFADADSVDVPGGTIVMRERLKPEEMIGLLRATVHSIDPALPLTYVESMEHAVEGNQTSQRFETVLISVFACIAVLLAMMGAYSVIAATVALRTQEMAIRLALGAKRRNVARLVLSWSVWLGLTGCAVGVIASVFATKLLRSLLFRVDPLDVSSIAGAGLVLVVMVAVAATVPAIRAARLNPIDSLHAE
jgi:putative ABC transport system permease protein